MDRLKITIIGGGSSYSGEIIEMLVAERDTIPVEEIVLIDIDKERLGIIKEFFKRYLKLRNYDIKITVTDNRNEVISGSQFVIIQIRVGGNSPRILDEKIPL